MWSLDLAEELETRGITVNALHPATFMDTHMVHESGISPASTVEEGADAVMHLALSRDLEGWTGLYFNGLERPPGSSGLRPRGAPAAGRADRTPDWSGSREGRMSPRPDGLTSRLLGRTGERVSAIGLGGWHLALKHVGEGTSLRIIRSAIERGITFLDNSWDYNEGRSELRMGKVLKEGYRDKVFLMTKIDGRSKREASRQLDESLRRLQTDHIDLVQHHEILRFEDPHRIFDSEGANAALVEAREAGKLRYIGFTGHKDPHIHLHMLEVAKENGFVFDTVQMPLNVMDAHYRSFEKLVLPELVKERIGVLGMKPLANGHILKSGTVTAIECLHYALNLPTSVVITGCDSMEVLDQALEALRTFRPMSAAEVEAVLAKTAKVAAKGEFELFKTTSVYDATASNPAWLGEEPKRVRQQVAG
jgi:aryl-alcohol dehydrogenase-like predicted oxidoreductase